MQTSTPLGKLDMVPIQDYFDVSKCGLLCISSVSSLQLELAFFSSISPKLSAAALLFLTCAMRRFALGVLPFSFKSAKPGFDRVL